MLYLIVTCVVALFVDALSPHASIPTIFIIGAILYLFQAVHISKVTGHPEVPISDVIATAISVLIGGAFGIFIGLWCVIPTLLLYWWLRAVIFHNLMMWGREGPIE